VEAAVSVIVGLRGSGCAGGRGSVEGPDGRDGARLHHPLCGARHIRVPARSATLPPRRPPAGHRVAR